MVTRLQYPQLQGPVGPPPAPPAPATVDGWLQPFGEPWRHWARVLPVACVAASGVFFSPQAAAVLQPRGTAAVIVSKARLQYPSYQAPVPLGKEIIDASKFDERFSEPVRPRTLPVAVSASSGVTYTPNPVFAESVGENKWHAVYPDRVPPKPMLHAALHQTLAWPSAIVGVIDTFAGGWSTQQNTPFQEPGLGAPYQGFMQSVAAQTVPETITVDKWWQPLSTPVRPVKLPIAAEAFYTGDPRGAAETVSEDKWHATYPDFVLPKPYPAGARTPFIAQVQLNIVETVTADKWQPVYPDRIARAQASRAPFESSVPQIAAERSTVDRWFVPFSEPVRAKPRLPAAANPAAQWPAQALLNPPQIATLTTARGPRYLAALRKKEGVFRHGWRAIARKGSTAPPLQATPISPETLRLRRNTLRPFWEASRKRARRRPRKPVALGVPTFQTQSPRPPKRRNATAAARRKLWRPPQRKHPGIGPPPIPPPPPQFFAGSTRFVAVWREKGIFRRRWRAVARHGFFAPDTPIAAAQLPAPVLAQQHQRARRIGIALSRKWKPRPRKRVVDIFIPPALQQPTPHKRGVKLLNVLRKRKWWPRRKHLLFQAAPLPPTPSPYPPKRQRRRVERTGHRRLFFPYQRARPGVGPPPRPIPPPGILRTFYRVLGPTRQMTAVGPLRSMTAVGSARMLTAVATPRRYIVVAVQPSTFTMAQTKQLQPPIDVGELAAVSFDFGPSLNTGIFITSVQSMICAVNSGGPDATPQSRIIGASAIVPSNTTGATGNQVNQLVGSMVGNTTYMLQCFVNTSDGQLLDLWVHLLCDLPA